MMGYKDRNKPYSSSYSKNFTQGYYKPKNPEKYVGNLKNIIYRSGMELKFCQLMDSSKRIIRWVSEPDTSPFPIKYHNPIKNNICNYYPDYLIEAIQQNGSTKTMVIEVKPKEKLKKPKRPSKYASKKTINSYNNKLKEFIINMEKYKASIKFCKRLNIEYVYITESFINNLR